MLTEFRVESLMGKLTETRRKVMGVLLSPFCRLFVEQTKLKLLELLSAERDKLTLNQTFCIWEYETNFGPSNSDTRQVRRYHRCFPLIIVDDLTF